MAICTNLFTGDQVHLNIYISLCDNGELTGWSFTPGKPIPSKMPPEFKRSHYFVYTTSAEAPYPTRQFWLDVKVIFTTISCCELLMLVLNL